MVLCCGNFFSDKPSCEEDWKKILTKKPKGIPNISCISLASNFYRVSEIIHEVKI